MKNSYPIYSRYLPLLVLLVTYAWPVQAQYNLPENRHWAFGKHAGLDFSSGAPVAVQTAIWGGGYGLWEASATISDTSGNLLFYTTGSVIWNRMHGPMPNAATLHGGPMPANTSQKQTESTSQGALIVPFPDSAGKYYVFSLTNSEMQLRAGQLFYSVVNMDLDGGRGDVEPGRKWIWLDSGLTEKMVAIPGTCNDVWVLVQTRDTNCFKAYRITADSLTTVPVLSYAGRYVYQYSPLYPGNAAWRAGGGLTVSHDWKKLVRSDYFGDLLELYDFDNSTGRVSSQSSLIDSNEHLSYSFYSSCFSPDNSKLYACTSTDTTYNLDYYYIYQYDMSSGDPALIRASKTFVGFGGPKGFAGFTLSLGTDGRIYFQDTAAGNIGAIRNPNLAGAACDFRNNAVQLLPGTLMSLGLQTPVVKAVPVHPEYRHPDIRLCNSQGLRLAPTRGMYRWQWQDGSRDSVQTVHTSGTYHVTGRMGCGYQTDTFVVNENALAFSLGPDTAVCDGSTLLLKSPLPDVSCLWQNGSRDSLFNVTESGRYWLYISRGNCHYTDTILVTMKDLSRFSLGPDTVICDNTFFEAGFRAEGARYNWSTGSTEPEIRIGQAGTYILRVTMDECQAEDTLQVSTVPAPVFELGPDQVLCQDRSVVLSAALHAPMLQYAWSTGDTTASITVSRPGIYHLTVSAGNGCHARDSVTVTRDSFPEIGLAERAVICPGLPLRLFPEVRHGARVWWSDGVPGPEREIHVPGIYMLHASNECGEAGASTEVSSVSCDPELPDAFTPNGDGRNDMFRIIGRPPGLSEPVTLILYDRWGKEVFRGNGIHSGWDGTLGGAPAPLGTYMYLLSYTQEGISRQKKGSFHLIR